MHFFNIYIYLKKGNQRKSYPEALWFDVVADEVVEQKEFLFERSSTPSVFCFFFSERARVQIRT